MSSCSDDEDEPQEEQKEETGGTINGHEYVDLGLPSGLLWATCNVGATNPEDYGNYYAWGETETKSDYYWNSSITYGKEIGDISGNATYDAAYANWGGTWRMPTDNEIYELISKCTWTWTTQGGHNGYKVIGPNGNSIFLPAAGGRYDGSSLDSAGSRGVYWSSTPNESDTAFACGLLYNSGSYGGYGRYDNFSRGSGRSVRPVLSQIK